MRAESARVKGGRVLGAAHTCPCTLQPPRIVEVEQDNKMTPGNLGIVFGPTLLRPRPTEATVSLSSLVDYPHQACIVETLITHFSLVFKEEPEEAPGGQVRASHCGQGMQG